MFTVSELDDLHDCLILLDVLYAGGELDGSEYYENIGAKADALATLVGRKLMQAKKEKVDNADDVTNPYHI